MWVWVVGETGTWGDVDTPSWRENKSMPVDIAVPAEQAISVCKQARQWVTAVVLPHLVGDWKRVPSSEVAGEVDGYRLRTYHLPLHRADWQWFGKRFG